MFLAFGLPHLASIAGEKSKASAPVQAEAIPSGQVDATPLASQPIGRPSTPDKVARPAQVRPLNKSSQAPSELNKVTLPDYVIEPPDILLIEGVSVVPKTPTNEINPRDVVSIAVLGTTPDRPIHGQFRVEPSGAVNLGPGYGLVRIARLTTVEAADAIRTVLLRDLSQPEVAVSLFQMAAQQIITGEHLVAPDGMVNLGLYGRVYVAGMTLDAARSAIEQHLAPHFDEPQVSLDVFVYNSKFFYIINEGAGFGQTVSRIPITGNETVLDAIAMIGGLDQTASTKLWISRPAPSGVAFDQVLPIDWNAITRGAATSTNYQLLPGDRLFIAEDRILAWTSFVSKMLNPFERMIGFTLLGSQTVQTLQRFPEGFQRF